MHAYEEQLRDQFDRLVQEHQARADSVLASIATKTTKHAEETVNYELERQAIILQKLVLAETHILLLDLHTVIISLMKHKDARSHGKSKNRVGSNGGTQG